MKNKSGMKNEINVNREILITLREIYEGILRLKGEQESVVSEIQRVLKLIDPSHYLSDTSQHNIPKQENLLKQKHSKQTQ